MRRFVATRVVTRWHSTMKLSVSLSAEDVAVLDAYVERTGLPSRSAAVQRAVRMLRFPTLEDDCRGVGRMVDRIRRIMDRDTRRRVGRCCAVRSGRSI